MLQEVFFQAEIIFYPAFFEFNPTSFPFPGSMAYFNTIEMLHFPKKVTMNVPASSRS
jgi:hypothetical protein